jgi:hypothetical protein
MKKLLTLAACLAIVCGAVPRASAQPIPPGQFPNSGTPSRLPPGIQLPPGIEPRISLARRSCNCHRW